MSENKGSRTLRFVAEDLPHGAAAEVREVADVFDDLLEACKALRTYFEEMIEVTDSPGTLQGLRIHHDIADRAIAKATGASQ